MTAVRLLQLTDLHLFADPDATLYGTCTRETLRQVSDDIRSRSTAFDFVIITGDHTHDERPETYEAVREILGPWLDRLLIVPGNHDDRDVMRTVLGDVIDRQCPTNDVCSERINFSVSAGEWRLLGVDTHLPGEVAGQFGSHQRDWLRDQLERHMPEPVMVFCHHPPVEIGSEWMDRIGITDRDEFVGVLNDYPCVPFVCCGHVHHDFEGRTQHARVVATPSTGLQFDPNGSEPTFANDRPGYRIIELNGRNYTTHVHRIPAAS